jgi:MFS family permease
MISWGAQYSFGVFFKPVLNEFGWTRAATSGAYSVSLVLMGICGIFAGRFNDRFGPRIVITFCGILIGIGYLLMSKVNAIWQIYLFYGVIISVGMSGMFVPLMSTAARWFNKRRGLASGIVVAGVGAGIIVMPILANYLITRIQMADLFLIMGGMALGLIVIIAQFLKRDPEQACLYLPDVKRRPQRTRTRRSTGSHLKTLSGPVPSG